MSTGIIIVVYAAVALLSLIGMAVLMLAGRQSSPGDVAVMTPPGVPGSKAPVDPRFDVAAARGNAPRVLSPEEEKHQRFQQRMVQAGIYRKGSTSGFYGMQLVMAIAPLLIAVVCVQLHWLSTMQALLMGAITAILAIVSPGLWLDYRKAVRQTAIRRALPDALDVIVVCLEAGLSLSAAMVKVGRELRSAHPMLSNEITIVYREVQLGNTTGAALLHFANRFDLEELRSLASVVRQAEKFGASIASALRVHGEALRIKRLQQAQEKAQKAAVKLLFPTVLCIFPSLFVVVLGPAAFDIMKMMAEHGAK